MRLVDLFTQHLLRIRLRLRLFKSRIANREYKNSVSNVHTSFLQKYKFILEGRMSADVNSG